MPVIHIPRTLRERLGEQGADELANLLNRATEDASRDTLVLAEEKYERRLSQEMAMMNQNVTETRAELNQHIAEVKTELDQRITEVKTELDQRITEVEARLQTQLAETKADLIRWMFIFWVGQLATILGVLFVFFK
ncbi:MAG: hypothetical protein D6791_13035 [Chloroflexi bacterium]|nr:MAG: hypothetical protein D6791_13035 [Chloroflexota bacterium]